MIAATTLAVGATSCRSVEGPPERQRVADTNYAVPAKWLFWYIPGRSFNVELDLSSKPRLVAFGSAHHYWMSWGIIEEEAPSLSAEAIASSVPEPGEQHGLELRRITLDEPSSASDYHAYVVRIGGFSALLQCGLMCKTTIPIQARSATVMFDPDLPDWAKVLACADHLDKALQPSALGPVADENGQLRDPGPC